MIDNEVKITICCLTYNHELYIKEAISSFIKQEIKFNFEILIFDDCSTDSTREIIENFQQCYPNLIRTLYPKENLFSKGRTTFYDLILEAKGEYIAFCEGDDYWCSVKKLQMQFNFLEENKGINLCFHPCYTLINNKLLDLKYGYKGDLEKFIDAKEVIKSSSGYIPMPSMMGRKNFYINIFNTNPDFFSNNLWHSTIQILGASTGEVGYLPQYSAVYRSMHEGSWSLNQKKSVESRMRNFESFVYRNRFLKNILPMKLGKYFDYILIKKILSFLIKEDLSILKKIKILKSIV